jgi:RES domain-containing protein
MTVSLWRIGVDAAKFKADDMQGIGARLTGGRWNSEGVAVVYSASSISLAVLETVVHLDGPPFNRYLVQIEVPDDVATHALRLEPLEVGWDAVPASMSSTGAGDAWLASGASALLRVPSTIVPEEDNILINPAHPDTARITARKVRRFLYDPRLL